MRVPTDTYLEETAPHVPQRRCDRDVLWQPNAVTDGDSLVHFRRADVIVAGNVFTTTRYPFIDVANGGTVDGEIGRSTRSSRGRCSSIRDRVERWSSRATGICPTSTKWSSTATWW